MSVQHAHRDHAPGLKAIRWNNDWITRPLFALVLALIAIFALFKGTIYFASLTALLTIPAAYEYHRMVSRGRSFRLEALITAAAVAVAVFALALDAAPAAALAFLALGGIAAAVVAMRQGMAPGWEALGALYLGLPSIALVSLRAFPPNGAYIIIGLFIIVWATDSGALICGNLIGGPRMAPTISPGKTWAGTIGGSLVAAVAFTVFTGFHGSLSGFFFGFRPGAMQKAFALALLISATAHLGDLFESFLKRRFGVKNSGAIIPGHGGVLDRMDSTLAAALVMALLVFVFHLDPLFGAHA